MEMIVSVSAIPYCEFLIKAIVLHHKYKDVKLWHSTFQRPPVFTVTVNQ